MKSIYGKNFRSKLRHSQGENAFHFWDFGILKIPKIHLFPFEIFSSFVQDPTDFGVVVPSSVEIEQISSSESNDIELIM